MAALPLSFLDALIKGAVVLGGAAVLVRLLRDQSAAARHAVWTTALLAQLTLPVLAIALPSWDLPILPRRAAPAPLMTPDAPRALSASPALPTPAASPAKAVPASDRIALHLPSTGAILLAVWLAGVVIVLARLGLGTATVVRFARRAQRVDDGEWLALAQRTAGILGIRRPITLLSGGRLQIPVTWGTVYPTVLLPHSAGTWSDERRRLVLTHELAHIQRFDALTQFVGQIALAIFWMNPLVWLAVHRMAVERECACDDYVLRGGTVASTYAQELLEIVRSLAPARGPAFAALAIAGRSDFERRVLAILSPNVQRRAVARGGAVAIAGIAALFVLPLASMRPVARQETSARRTAARRVITSPEPLVASRQPAGATGERRPGSTHRRQEAKRQALASQTARSRDVFWPFDLNGTISFCDHMIQITARKQTTQIAIRNEPPAAHTYRRCNISLDLSPDSAKQHVLSRVAIALDSARDSSTSHATRSLSEQGPAGNKHEQKLALGSPMPGSTQLPPELASDNERPLAPGEQKSDRIQALTRQDGESIEALRRQGVAVVKPDQLMQALARQGVIVAKYDEATQAPVRGSVKFVANLKLDKADSALIALLSVLGAMRLYDSLQKTSPAPAAGNRARTSAS